MDLIDYKTVRKHMEGPREGVLNLCLIVASMHSSLQPQERGMRQGRGQKESSWGSGSPTHNPVETKEVLL